MVVIKNLIGMILLTSIIYYNFIILTDQIIAGKL